MFTKKEKKIFRWIGSPGVGKDGILLIPGQEYEPALFGVDVVDSWVKSGVAEWVEPEKPEKPEPKKSNRTKEE